MIGAVREERSASSDPRCYLERQCAHIRVRHSTRWGRLQDFSEGETPCLICISIFCLLRYPNSIPHSALIFLDLRHSNRRILGTTA
jgi:hypothetical protein